MTATVTRTMNDEQRQLQELARDFALGELRPHSAAWDEARSLPDDIFEKLAESGFLGMLVPEEHGGLGFDFSTFLFVLEELAWGDPAVALSVAIHSGPVGSTLVAYGSAEQKGTWLPRLAAGEALGAFAFAAPSDGASPVKSGATATRDGESWRLDGEEIWVTNGGRADLLLLVARTSEEGWSAFLVPTDADGYRVGGRETTMGLCASETVSVTFDGVLVGEDAVVGDVDAALHYGVEAREAGRIGVAMQAVGIGRAAVEHAARYALERKQFGKEIARFGALQAKLADSAHRVASGRALTHEAAQAWEAARSGAPRTGVSGVTARAAMAKLAASEAATFAADEAVQIFGGYGYMRHYPVERLLRDAKGTEIYEGTNESLRRVVAREILRDSGDGSH
jgi:alkylation response protein AidB-like acyl-CoA dehydrogenase